MGEKECVRKAKESGEWEKGKGKEVLMSCMAVVVYDYKPSHPYSGAGTEHVGFSPTRQTLLASSAKRREVFGESHEG